MSPSPAELRSRLPELTLRDEVRLRRRLDAVRGDSVPDGLAQEVENAEQRLINLVEQADSPETGGMMAIKGSEAEKTAHNMSEMWSTFARTGRPAAKGQPAWPAYTTERRATMEIDAQCRIVDDPDSAEREIWKRLDG